MPLPGVLERLPRQLANLITRLRNAQEPRRWIGLDLGSRSITVAELERTPAGFRLIQYLIQELPAAPEGAAVDHAGWLATVLKEFSAAPVHISLGGPEVAVRRVQVPPMSKAELPEAVRWQVKEQVPFPVQDAVVAFQVTGEVWDKDVKKQDVLVAVASRSSVERVTTLVERAGSHVASLTPTQIGSWRCVTALIPETRQGSVAVIEIGARETDVTIVKDGEIRVVRSLAVGSDSLTEALVGVVPTEQGEVAIDRAKAEQLKRRYGVVLESTEALTEEGVPLFHLSSLMRPVLEQLVTELGRVFDFYKVTMGEGDVSRVLLCGGGASLKQLPSFLADGLGMTVEVFNPLIRITERAQPFEPEQVQEQGPRLAVAIGLAVDHGQGMTLLPAEFRRGRMSTATKRLLLKVGKACAAAAVALYAGLQLISGVLSWQIHGQQQRWTQLEPTYTQGMSVISRAKTLEATIAQSRRFVEQQPAWEGLFKEIGALIPGAVELDELRVSVAEATGPSAARFKLKGRFSAGGVGQEGGIATFVEALEASVFVADVTLASSELRANESGATTFELDGLLE